jgi:Tfp pilus assembly protein PilP
VVPAPAEVRELPPVTVPAAPIAAAPTQLASSIEVSGVVQAGDRTSAIVQLPQEGSRYVSAGDYLANGRILVKRIEIGSANTDPVVILEQNGVEVIRTVGSGESGVGLL